MPGGQSAARAELGNFEFSELGGFVAFWLKVVDLQYDARLVSKDVGGQATDTVFQVAFARYIFVSVSFSI